MLSNAIVAGAVAAAYVAALVLHLNPSIRLDDPAAWPLLGAVLLVYGVHLAVVFYAVIVARQVLSTEGVSPGWLSYRVLAWFCAAASTAAAALMWQNLWGFSAALDPDATRHFFVAAVAMTTCAVACVVLGVFRLWADRPGRLAAGAFGLVVLASIALPLAPRGMGDSSRLGARRLETSREFTPDTGARRVVLLAVDAASLDFISPAVADGRLPNFGRLLDGGASMHLATLRPTQPGPVWTAVATGKLPWRNGVRSAATYRAVAGGAAADLLPDFCFAHALVSFGLLTETLQTSAALLAEPVWTILGRAGLSSTIVRWPLTWPAQPLPGTLISDEFHRASEIALALDEPGLTYPPELASRLARVGHPSVDGSPQALEPEHPAVGATPLALDRFYVALADAIAAETPVRFTALRLQGLDIVGHYFLRYAMPQAFGDVSEEERGRFGRVFEQVLRVCRCRAGPAARPGTARRPAACGVAFRTRAAVVAQATAGADDWQSQHQRHPRTRARRVPAGVRNRGEAGPLPSRVGGRCHADPAVLLRAADRPRHGRLRPHGHLHGGVFGRAADCVHPDLREVT